jgi:hypothetical protein
MTKTKFLGPLEDLQAIVTATRIPGYWSELLSGHYQFRTLDGAVLNWWCSTGTVSFQGTPGAAKKLQADLYDLGKTRQIGELLKALPHG